MKTLRRITKNRAFTHVRILAAVLLVLTAAALGLYQYRRVPLLNRLRTCSR